MKKTSHCHQQEDQHSQENSLDDACQIASEQASISESASKVAGPAEKQETNATKPAAASIESEDKSSTSATIDLQAEVNKYRDQAMRTAADLENYRKRVTREKEDAIRYANRSLLEKLIPILDNFELGLEAAKATAGSGSAGIINGLSMVQGQLTDFLKDQGLETIDATGKIFDPKFHDAIGHEPHDSLPEGHVIRQMRRGYRLADRLVRPASVVVSRGEK
ncbi:MAG: nucleotide exchange factor GrpE [Chthoniobacterales bacterium]